MNKIIILLNNQIINIADYNENNIIVEYIIKLIHANNAKYLFGMIKKGGYNFISQYLSFHGVQIPVGNNYHIEIHVYKLTPDGNIETRISDKFKAEKSGLENIPHTYIQKVYESNESIQNSTQMMETIIAVNFVNLSLNIHYPMACRKTDIFSSVEKKLYQIFPELKNKKYYFLANSRVIDKYLTFEQNKIKSGDTILINENYLNK